MEEILKELLEQEAEKLTQAVRYERSEARQGYRSSHYNRGKPHDHLRRRDAAHAAAEVHLFRDCHHRTEPLWGTKVSPATISELNKKAYAHIDDWRNRPLQGVKYPYVYVDGIYLRRKRGGEYKNAAVLMAIA